MMMHVPSSLYLLLPQNLDHPASGFMRISAQSRFDLKPDRLAADAA
jgi:hypothetical protein